MLIWERFDNDDGDETWYTEWHDIDRMALIKKTQRAEHWAVIVGTVKDAEYTTRADTLSDAKAKSIRRKSSGQFRGASCPSQLSLYPKGSTHGHRRRCPIHVCGLRVTRKHVI